MKLPRDPKKVCSRIGLALFLMMLLWQAGVWGGTLLLGALAPALLQKAWAVWLVNDIALYGLGATCFLLVLRIIPGFKTEKREREPFGPGRFLLVLLFCLGGTYVANFLASLFLGFLAVFVQPQGAADAAAMNTLVEDGGPLLTFLFGVCVPALGEEFLFRVMLRRKLAGSGDKVYIFFSALCFATFHGNLSQAVYTFMVGAVLAWVYVITGTIWFSVVFHALINTVGLLVAPLALGSAVGAIIMVVAVLALMGLAIVVFFVARGYVFGTMQPPKEPGWPYTPPRQWMPVYETRTPVAHGAQPQPAGCPQGMATAAPAGAMYPPVWPPTVGAAPGQWGYGAGPHAARPVGQAYPWAQPPGYPPVQPGHPGRLPVQPGYPALPPAGHAAGGPGHGLWYPQAMGRPVGYGGQPGLWRPAVSFSSMRYAKVEGAMPRVAVSKQDAGEVCIGNAGMLCYLGLAWLCILTNLVAMFL